MAEIDTADGELPAARGARQGERVARTPALDWLARAGLVARGVVYGIIGVLALKLALGDGGKATNQQGALRTIAQQPFGKRAARSCSRSGSAGYALVAASSAPAIGHGPEAATTTFDRIAALASGIALRDPLRDRGQDPQRRADAARGKPQKPTGGVLGWTGGTLARRRSPGDRADRRRALPGVQGPQREVPRGLEDRAR